MFFVRSNLALHSCKVVEVLWRRGVFRSPPVYLMSKSPVRLGLSESVLRETKNVNVTAFNMVTRIKKAKTLIKHILCASKRKLKHVIQMKDEIMIIVNISVKNIARAKKFIVGILELEFVSIVSIYC